MIDTILWKLAVHLPRPINRLFTNLWKKRSREKGLSMAEMLKKGWE